MSTTAVAAGHDISRASGTSRRIAWIDPLRCIGCTKCIDACPFDAIIGAARRMHTVIESLCIGCDLCVAPCPVDCIRMSVAQPERALSRDEALAARKRREARRVRLLRESVSQACPSDERRQRIVEAALRHANTRTPPGDGAS